MSTREVGDVLGVDHKTVMNDLHAGRIPHRSESKARPNETETTGARPRETGRNSGRDSPSAAVGPTGGSWRDRTVSLPGRLMACEPLAVTGQGESLARSQERMFPRR